MIFVEGIRFKVDWSKFTVGATFWVPCLNPEHVMRQIQRICDKNDFKIKMVESVEHGVLGVRVWRLPLPLRLRSAVDILKELE